MRRDCRPYDDFRGPVSGVMPGSLIRAWWAPLTLDRGPSSLGLQTSRLGRARGPGPLARFRHPKRRRDDIAEPLGDLLAVPQLTAGAAGDQPQTPGRIQSGGQPSEQPRPLLLGERRRSRHVPPDLDPSRGGVHVLSSRSAGPGHPVLELAERKAERGAHDQVTGIIHGTYLTVPAIPAQTRFRCLGIALRYCP
jgi:hypothetical protein